MISMPRALTGLLLASRSATARISASFARADGRRSGDAEGSWLGSHYHWLIRTFWFSLIWGLVGGIFFVTLIGIPIAFVIWFAATVWVIYRLVRGWVLFKDNRPIPRM